MPTSLGVGLQPLFGSARPGGPELDSGGKRGHRGRVEGGAQLTGADIRGVRDRPQVPCMRPGPGHDVEARAGLRP